jgi:heme exporter protein A
MLLRVESLTLARGHRTLARDLSFTLAAGEAVILKGPNGSGKTTLLRTLAGLMPVAGGRIVFEEASQGAEQPTEGPEKLHYIGHANAVKPTLTARENLEFWMSYLGCRSADPDTARTADAALDRLGIAALADIRAAYYSAGQRRRLALARLVAVQRPLWLLDEPSVSLDAEGTATLAAMIREHVASGGAVIAATHIDLGVSGARELMLGRAMSEAA